MASQEAPQIQINRMPTTETKDRKVPRFVFGAAIGAASFIGLNGQEANADPVCVLQNPDGSCAQWYDPDPGGGGGGEPQPEPEPEPEPQPQPTNSPSNGGGSTGGGGGSGEGGSSGGGQGSGGSGSGGGSERPSQPARPSWEDNVAEACKDQEGNHQLAQELGYFAAPENDVTPTQEFPEGEHREGSQRMVFWVDNCDIQFETEVDAALGRPFTNLERALADPNNEWTPNLTQLRWSGATHPFSYSETVGHVNQLWALLNPLPEPTTTTIPETTTTTTVAPTTTESATTTTTEAPTTTEAVVPTTEEPEESTTSSTTRSIVTPTTGGKGTRPAIVGPEVDKPVSGSGGSEGFDWRMLTGAALGAGALTGSIVLIARRREKHTAQPI